MNFKEQKQIFSQNLKRILAEKRLAQIEVSDAIGVPPQTFNSWASGKALPRMDKVQRLADYLDVPKSALIDPPGKAPQSVEDLLSMRPDLDALLEAARALDPSAVKTLTELARQLGGARHE